MAWSSWLLVIGGVVVLFVVLYWWWSQRQDAKTGATIRKNVVKALKAMGCRVKGGSRVICKKNGGLEGLGEQFSVRAAVDQSVENFCELMDEVSRGSARVAGPVSAQLQQQEFEREPMPTRQAPGTPIATPPQQPQQQQQVVSRDMQGSPIQAPVGGAGESNARPIPPELQPVQTRTDKGAPAGVGGIKMGTDMPGGGMPSYDPRVF